MSDLQNTRTQHAGEKLLPFFILPVVFKTILPPPSPPPSPRPAHTFNPASTVFSPKPTTFSPDSTTFNPKSTTFMSHQAQRVEPFWHQFTPGVHYSRFYGVSRYINPRTVMMAQWDAVVAQRNASSPDSQPEPLMIPVSNDGAFIMSVPIETLRRFSVVAFARFSMEPDPTASAKGHARPWIYRDTNTIAQSHKDIDRQSTSNAAFWNQALAISTVPLKLDLKLMDVELSPTNWAVEHALRWMLKSATRPELFTRYHYKLYVLDDAALIDLYMAALVLDLVPFPENIQREIMKRLARKPLKLDEFRELHRRIPAADKVMDKAIHLIHDHWNFGRYTQSEHHAINHYMTSWEPLRWRRDFIYQRIRKGKMAARREFFQWQAQTSDNTLPSYDWGRTSHPREKKKKKKKKRHDSVKTQTQTSSDQQSEAEPARSEKTAEADYSADETGQAVTGPEGKSAHRKRNRRAQQARGKEKGKLEE